MKVSVIPIITGVLSTVTKRIGNGTGGLGNKRTGGDHPNYSISEIGLNTEKYPEDLRRLPVDQTPVRKHQLTLVLWFL